MHGESKHIEFPGRRFVGSAAPPPGRQAGVALGLPLRGLLLAVNGALAFTGLRDAAGNPVDASRLAACAISIPAEPPAEIVLIPAGEFRGRDGRKWTLTDPAAVIAASAALKYPEGFCVDIEHALLKDGASAPAAGWIGELFARDGAVWGKVEWTQLGANAITGKTYRGLSPVFLHDAAGKVVAFANAGLTNKRNLYLPALNEAGHHPETPDVNKLAEILGLAKDATEEQIAACAAQLDAVLAALTALMGVDLKAVLAMNAEQLKDGLGKKLGADVLVAVCTKAGVAASAGADAIETAFRAKGVDLSAYVPIGTYNDIAGQLARLSGDRVEAALNVALNERRIAPAELDALRAVGKTDLGQLQKLLAVRTPILGIAPNAQGNPPATALTADEERVREKLGLSADEFRAARA
jgi:phage I-like protein